MSSILDALKKLEKEKVHRDEISTAIASDILRSGQKQKMSQWRIPLLLFVLLAAGLVVALLSQPSTAPDTVPVATPPFTVPVGSTPPVTVDPVETITPAAALPVDLPLLSGIVYQQQAEARMAILNDLPVMEGTEIAGYTLREIFPDRIRLSRNGHSYTVMLTFSP